MHAAKSRRVALIYDATLPADVKVMSGVASYLQQGSPWSVYIEETALHAQRLPELRSWQGDGIIADLDDPRVAEQIQNCGIPTVAFGSGYGWYDPSSGVPYFYTDSREIARLAAEHLMERGFRQFAYCGYHKGPITGFSAEREAAFAQQVEAHGGRLAIHHGPYKCHRQWESFQRRLCSWLASLPKPIGLMAASDKAARSVLEACRSAGIAVPEEIAVVGVDNDEMLCQLSHPPLTSIEHGTRQIGYQAAALLDRLMAGQQPRQRKFVVPPEGVIARRSSDVLAVDDTDVAEALSYIRAHACEAIGVGEIVSAASVSRSKLERKFRAVTGRTLHEEISLVRLQQAQRLVTATRLPLKQIAGMCGFRTVQRMSEAFRHRLGMTPAAFRASCQIPPPGGECYAIP
jgi:LacI family transcriptional regulator